GSRGPEAHRRAEKGKREKGERTRENVETGCPPAGSFAIALLPFPFCLFPFLLVEHVSPELHGLPDRRDRGGAIDFSVRDERRRELMDHQPARSKLAREQTRLDRGDDVVVRAVKKVDGTRR